MKLDLEQRSRIDKQENEPLSPDGLVDILEDLYLLLHYIKQRGTILWICLKLANRFTDATVSVCFLHLYPRGMLPCLSSQMVDQHTDLGAVNAKEIMEQIFHAGTGEVRETSRNRRVGEIGGPNEKLACL